MIHKKLAKTTERLQKDARDATDSETASSVTLTKEQWLIKNKETDKPCSSKTIQTMPSHEPTEAPDVTVISDSQSTMIEEIPNADESDPEVTVTAKVKYTDCRKAKPTDPPSDAQTAKIVPPVG